CDIFEVLRYIKGQDLSIPVIVISDIGGQAPAVKAIKAGADEYITRDDVSRFVPVVISELRQAHVYREQKESQHDFARKKFTKERDYLFNLSIDMLCISDFDGNFKQVNPAFTKTLGWDAKDLLSKPYIDFIHPDDRPAMRKAMYDLFEGREVRGFESRYLCKDGSCKWVSWNAFSLTKEGLIFVVARDMTEYKGAQTALKTSETEKRLILESIRDLVVHQDLDNRIIWANSSAAEAFGKTIKELEGAFCYKAFHDKDKPCENCPVVKSTETGRLEKAEMAFADGRQWIISGNPIKNASGNVIGVVEVAVEITERKKAEEEARLSATRISYLSKYANDFIILLDENFRFIEVNERVVDFYGYTSEELKGMYAPQFRTPAAKKDFLNQIKVAQVSGKALYETMHQRKDGTKFPVEISLRAIDNEGKRFYQAVIRDITERKKAQDALKKSEEEYRLLFEDNPHPMWVYDLKTLKFIAVNDAAVSHYGYSRAEFLSMTVKDIRPKEDIPRLLSNIKKVKASGGFDNAGNWRHRKKDGTIIDVEIVSHVITFAGRAAELVLASDITERKKVEKLKESLIRDISHELKTPVAILEMAHDMTGRALATGNMEQVHKTQAISHDCIRRLRKDISNILQFSILEKSKANKFTGVASLHEVVKKVMTEIKLIVGEDKDITFRINIPSALDRVAITESHLHILLYNVLENAVKFTQQGTIVLRCGILNNALPPLGGKHFSTKKTALVAGSAKGNNKEYCTIVIKDTGCGISNEQQDKVFVKFFKEHAAISGTGLGLVICKDIVQMYAGTIKVKSSGTNKGTTVTITLPRV
ncbi:MAG: PAS domain S-box protein, partial [Candidatus Omnitrophica bacterium]|nr:PAS domain S-box protein [Candidatus Omnitrophota bacterium]